MVSPKDFIPSAAVFAAFSYTEIVRARFLLLSEGILRTDLDRFGLISINSSSNSSSTLDSFASGVEGKELIGSGVEIGESSSKVISSIH